VCVFKVWGESHCWIDIPKIRCWSRLKEELSEWVPKVRCRIWWGGLDKTGWECIVGDGWKFWWRMSKQCEGMKRRSEAYVSCFTVWNILHALNVPRPVCLCGCSWWSTVWHSTSVIPWNWASAAEVLQNNYLIWNWSCSWKSKIGIPELWPGLHGPCCLSS